jgi:hypothetical protein
MKAGRTTPWGGSAGVVRPPKYKVGVANEPPPKVHGWGYLETKQKFFQFFELLLL